MPGSRGREKRSEGYLREAWRPRHAEIWLRRLAAAAVFGGLAWAVIANTASDSLAERNPESALTWRDNANALIGLARNALQRDGAQADAEHLRDLANEALRTTPLESRALWVLGSATEIAGDDARAEKLMALAAERSRRDPVVQTWLFYELSRQGRFAEALGYADALLRTRPNQRDAIGPTLLAYAADPAAIRSIIIPLAADPPWRGWYLTEVGKQVKDPGMAYALFDALKDSRTPPRPSELRPHLDALVGAGLFEQAYLTWIHHLPADRQQRLAFAYNGDFEQPVSGLPFDWSIDNVAGATTKMMTPGYGDEGTAVEVSFSGRRVGYRHLRKLLLLPPGLFRLTLQGRSDALVNERGLVWRVTCAEGEKQSLGSTPAVMGSFPWREMGVDFEVPHEACRAQWLTLLVDARAALDQDISGAVGFDEIVVDRPPAADLQAAR